MERGSPNGFVRAIRDDGSIYEGCFQNGYRSQWGRYVWADGKCQIGWWKESYLHGNSRKFRSDRSIHQEGWFDQGLKGEFQGSSKDYVYWDMKDKYFAEYEEKKKHKKDDPCCSLYKTSPRTS